MGASMLKAIIAIALLFANAPAGAVANLIENSGFETGSFSGWTRTGSLAREASRVVRTAALDGTWGARFSQNIGYGGISQTFATPNFAETRYIFSFSFRHSAGRAEFPQYGLQVSLFYPQGPEGGDSLAEYRNRFRENYEFTDWQNFSVTTRTLGPMTTLSFGFFDLYSTAWDLDAISVTEVPFVSQVPEPSVWAMALAGFALTGLALRRRSVASCNRSIFRYTTAPLQE